MSAELFFPSEFSPATEPLNTCHASLFSLSFVSFAMSCSRQKHVLDLLTIGPRKYCTLHLDLEHGMND